MSKLYLPPRVIKYMLNPKYLRDGCEVEFVEEEFNGELLHRWIVDNTIVWSASPDLTHGYNDEHLQAMTGQEFYKRFIQKNPTFDSRKKSITIYDDAILAAKRAAGLSETEG